ncbi:MobA/MobL family protein (plasmid) [Jannaschia sp. M317]|nr:MobA/MobL family protein [Jannaschia sp. M317]
MDAQVAREYELSLPHELDLDAHVGMVGRFAGLLVERFGVVADCAVHRPPDGGDPRNLIVVVLTPTRRLEGRALMAKLREMSPRTVLVELRAAWARIMNEALAAADHEVRVDHRSLAERRLEALVEGDTDRATDLDRKPRPRRPQREVQYERLTWQRATKPEAKR